MALLEIDAAQLHCSDAPVFAPSAAVATAEAAAAAADVFPLSGLFEAASSGDPQRVRDALLTLPPTVDLNQRSCSGDTVVHIAAVSGSVPTLEALEQRGADLHQLNAACENGLHVACRRRDARLVKFFADRGVCLDAQNRAGKTAVHLVCDGDGGAVTSGDLRILSLLCRLGASVNIRDRCLRTPLLAVVSAPSAGEDAARILLGAGARPDLPDRDGWDPLRHAIQRGHAPLALLLISAGAPVDLADDTTNGCDDSALHAASSEGHLAIAQALCAYGCRVDPVNSLGFTPLHLAARAGHLEVVRCLLLAGANPHLPSRQGVTPEVMSLAQGHRATGSLLGRMRPERRAMCVEQLVPTQRQLPRIKLKLFGQSGSGKTSLVESLRSNRITGFLRRTFRGERRNSVGDFDDEVATDGRQCFRLYQRSSEPSELNFDVHHEAYTRGVAIQSMNVTDSGDFSVWEFSGYEPYYVFYDHFIGDTSCVHAILFSLAESFVTMRQRVMFWLHFLLGRLPAREPLGYCGMPKMLARVLLIGTHADAAAVFRNGRRGLLESSDAEILLCEVLDLTRYRLEVCPEVFVVDTSEAMSTEMKALRQRLADWRADILKQLPCANGFFDVMALGRLNEWASEAEYPVYTWQQFVDAVRTRVNPLCSEDHLKDLVQELQYTGDVIYLESEAEQDMIVLSPQWLCSSILGYILSYDNISQARVTGSFSVDDVQFMTGETDAPGLVGLLSAMDLCTRVEQLEDDDEAQYEFPCLNFLESVRSPWEEKKGGILGEEFAYVGLQLRAARSQLAHIFPRLQCRLRRSLRACQESLPIDLLQWFHGSKLSLDGGSIECSIRLEEGDQLVRLRARGPPARAQLVFGIFRDVANLLEQTIEEMCPGLEYQSALISPRQLSDHRVNVTLTVTQGAIFRAMLQHRRSSSATPALETATDSHLISFPPPSVTVMLGDADKGETEAKDNEEIKVDEEEEELENLICLGSRQLLARITPGPELPLSALRAPTLQRLCRLLDPPDPLGRDWCLLAVRLGLTHSLPGVHGTNEWLVSRTAQLLDEWTRRGPPGERSIGALIDVCREMGRQDACELLTEQAPMYAFVPMGATHQ